MCFHPYDLRAYIVARQNSGNSVGEGGSCSVDISELRKIISLVERANIEEIEIE
jgi:hypothetical protein